MRAMAATYPLMARPASMPHRLTSPIAASTPQSSLMLGKRNRMSRMTIISDFFAPKCIARNLKNVLVRTFAPGIVSAKCANNKSWRSFSIAKCCSPFTASFSCFPRLAVPCRGNAFHLVQVGIDAVLIEVLQPLQCFAIFVLHLPIQSGRSTSTLTREQYLTMQHIPDARV
jgi:hypothetical protein